MGLYTVLGDESENSRGDPGCGSGAPMPTGGFGYPGQFGGAGWRRAGEFDFLPTYHLRFPVCLFDTDCFC